MTVYALAHDGLLNSLTVTTHPHAEAANQFIGQTSAKAALVVIAEEDLAMSGPLLVKLLNLLNPEGPAVNKFATKKDGQRRVFTALEAKYRGQPHEPFNPVETSGDEKADNQSEVANPVSPEGAGTTENDMATKKKATKKKAAKSKGERKPRASAPLYEELNTSAPKSDMTCGCYIRSLLMRGKHTTEDILGLVKKHYPESSAKGSDVSWNRQKLRNAGKRVPEVAKA